METIGLIARPPNAPGIAYDAWLAVIASHPDLEEMEAVRGLDPFTQQQIELPRPYAAWVMREGIKVGTMIWEADAVHVSGQPEAVLAIAEEVAALLSASLWTLSELEG
jgi:hypothetical protein